MNLREMATYLFAVLGAQNSLNIFVSNELSFMLFHVTIYDAVTNERYVSGRVRYIGHASIPAECEHVETTYARGIHPRIDSELVGAELLCKAFLIYQGSQAEKGHSLTIHRNGNHYRMVAPFVEYKDLAIAGDALYKTR